MAKGIAILFMLFYHLFSVPGDNALMKVDYSPLPENIFLLIAKFGNICVSVFVFLTAYGISLKLFKKENLTLKDAYEGTFKRTGKLLFNFLFMFLVVNLIWFRYFNYALCYGPGKQGVLSLIVDALGLSHFFGTPTMNMTWWYMSLAYMLIFFVPAFAFLCKKISYPFLGIAFLLPFVFPVENDLARYLFVIAVGIVSAYGNRFEKIMNSKVPAPLRFVVELAVLVLSVFIRENAFVQSYLLYFVDAVIAFNIILFASDFIGFIPGVRKIFALLGRHSMNIFFVHTFFYLILYRKFVFRFQYAAVTFLILLALSLALSLVLEGLKALVLFLWRKITQKRQAPEDRS